MLILINKLRKYFPILEVKNKYFVDKPSTTTHLYQHEVRRKYVFERSNVLALQHLLWNLKVLNIKEAAKVFLNPVSIYSINGIYYSYMNVQ